MLPHASRHPACARSGSRWRCGRAIATIVRDRGCCSIDSVDDARRVATTRRAAALRLEPRAATSRPGGHATSRTGYARASRPIRACAATSASSSASSSSAHERPGRRISRPATTRAPDAAARWRRCIGRATRSRDQAYVLHRLDQDQLRSAVFALGGDESKADVRAEAAALGLGTAAKPESQDLCFVDADMRSELRLRLAGRFAPGPITDTDGTVLGEHEGLPFFTVGQRAGLGIAPSTSRRRAALRDRAAARLPTRWSWARAKRCAASAVEAASFRWVAGVAPPAGTACEAQLRAHGDPHPARVEAARAERCQVRFDTPVDQAAPGQSVVLYRGDEVLGGGLIRRAA